VEGSYRAGYERIRVLFLGMPGEVGGVLVDGKQVSFESKENGLEVVLSKVFAEVQVVAFS